MSCCNGRVNPVAAQLGSACPKCKQFFASGQTSVRCPICKLVFIPSKKGKA